MAVTNALACAFEFVLFVHPPPQSFVALDREQQRLVRDYQPVSAALTAYELSFRDWRLGRLSRNELVRRAGT